LSYQYHGVLLEHAPLNIAVHLGIPFAIVIAVLAFLQWPGPQIGGESILGDQTTRDSARATQPRAVAVAAVLFAPPARAVSRDAAFPS
jgi:hypothetical protein